MTAERRSRNPALLTVRLWRHESGTVVARVTTVDAIDEPHPETTTSSDLAEVRARVETWIASTAKRLGGNG